MELIDFGQLAIGGVNLILLVLGCVEAAKRLGISGQGSFIMALVCGVAFTGLWQAMNTGLVPEAVLPWIRVVIVGLAGGVAATGLYDIGKKVAIGAENYVDSLFQSGTLDETIDTSPGVEYVPFRQPQTTAADETLDR